MAILCCVCGTAIEPNSMNMCTTCIASEVDIAEGIGLESELLQCSGCLRFQSRPRGVGQSTNGAWLECQWESAELMALCLKHVHGLSKAKLMDANFIWTEPHSKRVKVKLTLQREVMNHAMVQNSCVVTYVIKNLQCPDCVKQYRNNHWRALVQVRQKTEHKRTFFRLEQLLLKHKAHENAIGITTVKEGLDFYFGTKSAGERFVHFLSSRVPMRSKFAQKMVSENIRQGTANMQTVYSVELSPISKDDLVLLPPKTAQSCSSISRLALCSRTTSMLHFIDPRTGRRGELIADKYWKLPFLPLETSQNMVEFVVLDVEPVHSTHGSRPTALEQQGTDQHMVLADIEVARASDFGVNDTTFHVRSHLGGLLEAGDSVKGYDLSSAIFGSAFTYSLKEELPDVVLVRKIYPREHRDRKNDKKLKKLTSERGVKLSKAEAARYEKEFEQFEEDFLEEEEEEDDVVDDFVPVDGDEEVLDGGDDDDVEPPVSDDEEKELTTKLNDLQVAPPSSGSPYTQ